MSDPQAAAMPTQALAIALRAGRDVLRETAPDPMREARLLLAHAAGVTPSGLVALEVEDFTPDLMARYLDMVGRRQQRMPLSHILGYRDFYNHRFQITPDVLDPRPETETLITAALAAPFAKVLDLGTGSGCILISLVKAQEGATGLGVDLSAAALNVADINARALWVAHRVRFLQCDWFAAVDERFDLIVANPPYIRADEMADLAPEVREFEPRLALTDEGDGLGAYRRIAAGVQGHLTPGGRVLVEVGLGQSEAVGDLFAAVGLVTVTTHPDLDGRARVVSAVAAQDRRSA